MKTQISKPAEGKASYSEEYKEQALELWRKSGRSANKVAAELGIRPAKVEAATSRKPGARNWRRKSAG
jgi:transposase-like protein